MSLPWLQEVDPAELLPDDTKWEEHDELTLYKQCKLRGMDKSVEKEGDALRILNQLKNYEIRWSCYPKEPGVIGRSSKAIEAKAFATVMSSIEKQNIQVLRIEEREVIGSSDLEMVIEMSNATVRIGDKKHCSCGFEFWAGLMTCTHILYLERYVLKCPEHLHKRSLLLADCWTEYFSNAPLAFRPRELAEVQETLTHTISDKECQLCFKEIATSSGIVGCRVCRRVAHQQCHDVYRTRKAACEGNTGCPLCCPQCPWNPSKPELKTELLPMEVKEEPWTPREGPATTGEGLSRATKLKIRKLEKQVRRLRCQLHRKPASRVMSSLRYERLVGKIGRKGTKYRRHQLAVVAKEALKSEDARPKDEDKAAVFKEEMESPVKIIKVEKTKKVKSEPVVISLL